MPISYWLPPAVWMAVIAWFSSGTWSADNTQSMLGPILSWLAPSASPTQVTVLHGIVRKLAHLTEYGILAALWFRAFARGARLSRPWSAAAALALTVGWAGLDEFNQSFLPRRSGSPWDVLIDTTGALLALVAGLRDWRSATDLATATLLWLAAAGGATLLLVNTATGVGSGALWLTVPAASLALVALKLSRRIE